MSRCLCVVGGETLYFTHVKLKFGFFFCPQTASVTFVCAGADNRIRSGDKNTAGIYEVNEGQRRRARRRAPPARVCVCGCLGCIVPQLAWEEVGEGGASCLWWGSGVDG